MYPLFSRNRRAHASSVRLLPCSKGWLRAIPNKSTHAKVADVFLAAILEMMPRLAEGAFKRIGAEESVMLSRLTDRPFVCFNCEVDAKPTRLSHLAR